MPQFAGEHYPVPPGESFVEKSPETGGRVTPNQKIGAVLDGMLYSPNDFNYLPFLSVLPETDICSEFFGLHRQITI